MNGISLAMVFGALVEIAFSHSVLIAVIAAILVIEIALLLRRARDGQIQFARAVRRSIGVGALGFVVIGYGLLSYTKAGIGDLHGWIDYTVWLLATLGLATGLALVVLPGFAAMSVRR